MLPARRPGLLRMVVTRPLVRVRVVLMVGVRWGRVSLNGGLLLLRVSLSHLRRVGLLLGGRLLMLHLLGGLSLGADRRLLLGVSLLGGLALRLGLSATLL